MGLSFRRKLFYAGFWQNELVSGMFYMVNLKEEVHMPKKILVVDDEPDFVRIVLAKLKSNGYEAISAVNGKEGIKVTRLQNPDLIVMDIILPDMDGMDTARLLQADVKTENIPIIFISGAIVNMPENAGTRQANFNGKILTAIAKPFKVEKLLFEINQLFKFNVHQ